MSGKLGLLKLFLMGGAVMTVHCVLSVSANAQGAAEVDFGREVPAAALESMVSEFKF